MLDKGKRGQSSGVKDWRRIGTWISVCLLFVLIAYFALTVKRTFAYRINADDASELILSSLLSQEHHIITQDWYYSTELRFLNTQLVFAPLFFITNNWHVVRVAGAGILVLILACSAIYMCRGMGLRQGAVLIAILMCVPVSAEYYQYVIERSYYIPHIATILLTIGMMFRLNRKELCTERTDQHEQTQLNHEGRSVRGQRKSPLHDGTKRDGLIRGLRMRPCVSRVFLFLLSFLLALGTGLGGPRLLILFYLPLFLTTVLVWAQSCLSGTRFSETYFSDAHSKERSAGTRAIGSVQDPAGRYMIYAFLILCGAAAGYLINAKVLSKTYHYRSYGDMSFISFHFERFLAALMDFLGSFGWRTGKVSMATLIPNVLAGLLFAGSFFFAFRNAFMRRNEEKQQGLRYLSLFYLVSVFVYCCLYGLTGMSYLTRYNLPIAVLALPVVGASLHRQIRKTVLFERWEPMWRAAGICGCILLSAMFWRFSEVRNEPGTSKYIQAVDYLSRNQYGTVYASFWNGNLFTELSNGRIRSRAFTDNMDGAQNIDGYYEWLQVVNPEEPEKDERVAFVLTEDEVDHCKWKCNLREKDLVFSAENLRVYGFKNHDAMIRRFYGSYRYDFADNAIFQANALDTGSSRILYSDGSSFGPYILLKPGKYRIEVKGAGLDGAVSYCTSGGGQLQYETTQRELSTEGDQQTLSYVIENDSEALNFEIIVQNPSSDEVRINSIRMDQISD